MSDDLVAHALWLDMPPARKLVLSILCQRAELSTGLCWPGIAEISAKSSLSNKSVIGHLQGLKTEGWLKNGRRPTRAGMTMRRWVNTRRILDEGQAKREAWLALQKTKRDSASEETSHGFDDEPCEETTHGQVKVASHGQVKLLRAGSVTQSSLNSQEARVDDTSLLTQRTASDASDHPGEKFFSPGPEEELEIPEPDWSAADLPPRLRLLSSRLCDSCSEAFTAVEGQEICGECLAAYVASRRDARSAPGVPS